MKTAVESPAAATPGAHLPGPHHLEVLPFAHPQGCRGYLIRDPESRQTLALDPHLDLVDAMEAAVREQRGTLPYVVETHTHADHPSGAAELAARFGATRIAHERAGHVGVTRHVRDGDVLHLGDHALRVLHAPGHTPDHIVLVGDGALFSGDTLLVGGVARTDFLGGDAGQLHDTLRRLLAELPDDTVLFPGHDYAGHTSSTLGAERTTNPWLQITDRDVFASSLTANPPPRPANMDRLLKFNREGDDIPERVDASTALDRVRAGGAASVIDVRTAGEFAAAHVPGSVHVPLDELASRLDEVRAVPAPRLLLCAAGSRAEVARRTLAAAGVGGLSVVAGGLAAYRDAGGPIAGSGRGISLERQVRIAAGGLVVLGVALGWLVHPAGYALAALVGLGLVNAGITDWCGMGLLLARMPWNRRAGAATGGAAAAGRTCAASAPPAACAARRPTV